MRRTLFTLAVSLCVLVTLTGCSLFGTKEQRAAADPYDPGFETATAFDNDPVYEPLPEPATPRSYPVATSTLASTTGAARIHTVAKKETLYSIARMYYNGDHARWKDIYRANQATISDPNFIRVGQELVIP